MGNVKKMQMENQNQVDTIGDSVICEVCEAELGVEGIWIESSREVGAESCAS